MPKRVKRIVIDSVIRWQNGTRWHIRVADKREQKIMDADRVDGLTFPEAHLILISNRLRGKRLDEVIIHELLHACFPWPKPIVSHRTEERVVSVIAPFLAHALRCGVRLGTPRNAHEAVVSRKRPAKALPGTREARKSAKPANRKLRALERKRV